jgi:hypothetical protein
MTNVGKEDDMSIENQVIVIRFCFYIIIDETLFASSTSKSPLRQEHCNRFSKLGSSRREKLNYFFGS